MDIYVEIKNVAKVQAQKAGDSWDMLYKRHNTDIPKTLYEGKEGEKGEDARGKVVRGSKKEVGEINWT